MSAYLKSKKVMIDLDKLEELSEPNENWKILIGENRQKNEDFAVSCFGRIYSTKHNKIVKQYNNPKTGYNYFYLNDYGSTSYNTMHTHRAVALTWLDFPTNLDDSDYYVVDHINEIKTDNRKCNLQWISQQVNVTRATAIKRRTESLKKTVEIRKKMQEKDAMIEKLTLENRLLRAKLLKYEDTILLDDLVATKSKKEKPKKQKFDYKQLLQ